MADTQVSTDVHGASDHRRSVWGPYYIDTLKGVKIHCDGGSDLNYNWTDDGGITWAQTQITGSNDTKQMACWFDQETPGDSGTIVHIVVLDNTADEFHYSSVDVSDGTNSGNVDIDPDVGVSGTAKLGICAITKARNGNLIATMRVKAYRSVDGGSNWTARTAPGEDQADFQLLYPANVADGDVAMLYWDRSATEISVLMYDDSENTWTETSILTSMTADDIHLNIDAAVMHSDGKIYGAAHTAHDTSTDDLVTFTVDPSSISSPTIVTSTANVFTDEAESGGCAVHINQQNDDIRIGWCSGDEFWETTTAVVYKLSTDKMVSFGSELSMSETSRDWRIVSSGRTTGSGGGRYQPGMYDDDATAIYINLVNDIEIAAAPEGVAPRQTIVSRAVPRASSW